MQAQYESREAALEAAAEFMTEARKWGKHVNQPFSAVQLLEVLEAYEARLAAQKVASEQAAEIQSAAHQRLVSELTGKIGGLQKKINSLDGTKR